MSPLVDLLCFFLRGFPRVSGDEPGVPYLGAPKTKVFPA